MSRPKRTGPRGWIVPIVLGLVLSLPVGVVNPSNSIGHRPLASTATAITTPAAGAPTPRIAGTTAVAHLPPNAWQYPTTPPSLLARGAPLRGVHPAATGGPAGTLFVQNGTLLPGTVSPTFNLAMPLGIDYLPTNRSVYVAGAFSATAGQYNPTTGAASELAGTCESVNPPQVVSDQTGSVVYDTQDQTVFIAGPTSATLTAVNITTGVERPCITDSHFPYGSSPVALAFDPRLPLLWVADAGTNNVTVFNTTTMTGMLNIRVGVAPDALAFDPSTELLYAANFGSGTVSVINITTNAVVRSITVGANPVSIVRVPATETLWVLNRGAGTITVVDGIALTIVSNLTLASGSAGAATTLAYDSGLKVVYALNAPTGALALFNVSTYTAISTATVGGIPYAAAYDPLRSQLDVVNIERNTLDIIDDGSNGIVHSYALGGAPTASLYDATTGLVYASDAAVYWVDELDARTDAVVGKIVTPAPILDLAIDVAANEIAAVGLDGNIYFISGGTGTIVGSWGPNNGTGFLHATYGNGEFFFTGGTGATFGTFYNDVYAVSASSLVELAVINSGPNCGDLVYDSSNRFVYVTTGAAVRPVNSVNNAPSVLIALNSSEITMAITWDNVTNSLLVSGLGPPQLEVYNLTSSTLAATTLPGVSLPAAVLYVWWTNRVYVTDFFNDTLTTANPSTLAVVSNVITGFSSFGLGYSPYSGTLYVSNEGDGTISLVILLTVSSEPLAVSLTISPSSVRLGSAVTLRALATFPEWSDNFTYGGLPASCPSKNLTVLACTSSAGGTFTITVTVRNPLGFRASGSANFAVVVPLALVSFTLTPMALTQNTPTHVKATYSGGAGPFTVGYPQRPPGCPATTSVNWTCTPTTAGGWKFGVVITDSIGQTVSNNLTLTVNPTPMIVSFNSSNNDVNVGQSLAFTVVLVGGTSPFSYTYTGLPPGCPTVNSSTFTCKPSAGGVYPILVRVVDADGVAKNAQMSQVVSAPSGSSAGPLGLSTTSLLAIIAVIALVVVAAVALATRRRRAPAPRASGPPPPTYAGQLPPPIEPPTTEASVGPPEGMVVEPLPPEPLLPPPPPPPPTAYAPPPPPPPPAEGEPVVPRFHVDPDQATAAPARVSPAASTGGGRPMLVCKNCGTVNEPWLTVCRKCKRTLFSTSGT